MIAYVLLSTLIAADEPSPLLGKINTWDAWPFDAGHGAIELGWSRSMAHRWRDADGTTHDRDGTLVDDDVTLQAYLGLADSLDLRLKGGWRRIDDQGAFLDTDGTPLLDDLGDVMRYQNAGRGADDVEIRVAWQIWRDDDWGLAVALLPATSLRTGNDATDTEPGTSPGAAWAELAAAVSWTVGPLSVAVDGAGRGWWGAHREGLPPLWYQDIALGWQVDDIFQPEIELNLAWSPAGDDIPSSATVATTVGVMANLDPWYVSVGMQIPLGGRSTDDRSMVSGLVTYAW